MRLAAAIPTLSRADLLREAVEPLLRHRNVFSQVVVLDNGQQGLKWLTDRGVALELSPRNLGFGGSCNWAIERLLSEGSADWLLIHSDDVVLSDASVAGLPGLCERYADKWLLRGKASWSIVLLSRACAEATRYAPGKYLDEAFWPGDFEDLDFEWRISLLDPTRMERRLPELYPAVWRRKSSHGAIPNFKGHHRNNKSYFLAKWGTIHPKNRYRVPFNGEKTWP